eukprot:TRINITY_DN37831_c0_g1_i1.p1 TRINITY_DN37831_c0_g1~~TRINITY_DN37831_c0_g1_i1.p1  ORF type:complete len:154 (-),score=45.19 TRINITY_DN37831_c0_g1_i1:199-624(-)
MASAPTVGSTVLVSGRSETGVVLIADPSDPSMTYKVEFADGSKDWFKQDDVTLDSSEPVDEEAVQRAAEEMAALKLSQEKHAAEQAKIMEDAKKDLEKDRLSRSKADYKEETYTDAPKPKTEAAPGAAPLSTAMQTDNEVF